ncbi:MAG TPA: glycine cleavage T C-terminal barrel domain-containing protein [Bryobacteraceae bacterium]|nr:glycine cleavage T C-terminal barrel domain-containing protein [Bryobacteraceae bacterium]
MTEGYEALRRGGAWMDVSARGRIVVRGRDRARLLHNLTSNEVNKMQPGQGCYAFLLNPQGRIQADLTLFCLADHFLIDTEPELREKVRLHINKYIIADQVELEDVTESTGAVALEGPEAAAVMAKIGAPAPSTAYAHEPWGDATVARTSLTGQPGYRIYCGSAQTRDMMAKVSAAGARQAGEDDLRAVRIENGRPLFGEDIRETSLPQETQQMHAVSFTKGCYLGQEIVERIRAQGHVNKKLVRLTIRGGDVPAPGCKLLANGADAGEITSAAVSPESGEVAALAYVRTNFADAGTELDAGGKAARVR